MTIGFVERGGVWVLVQAVLFVVILASGWLELLPFDPPSLIGNIVFFGGIAILGMAFWSLGRNVSPYPEPLDEATLVDNGIYGLVRHPMYTGVIVTMLGFSIRSGSWLAIIASAGLVIFFWLKTDREEQALRQAYPAYEAYANRVPHRIIPFLL